MKEEYVRVLDYLPNGYAGDRRAEPVIQSIGETFFTLLELIPKSDASISQEERLYVGTGERDKVKLIKRRLHYNDLTSMSKSMLKDVIKSIVKDNEQRFVEFFNKSRTITPRMHQLELLPGIGKKHVKYIIEEREKEPFKSFDDMKKRIHLLPDLYDTIAERVLEEMHEPQKYYLFVRR